MTTDHTTVRDVVNAMLDTPFWLALLALGIGLFLGSVISYALKEIVRRCWLWLAREKEEKDQ